VPENTPLTAIAREQAICYTLASFWGKFLSEEHFQEFCDWYQAIPNPDGTPDTNKPEFSPELFIEIGEYLMDQASVALRTSEVLESFFQQARRAMIAPQN
jgi:hypothetical protein